MLIVPDHVYSFKFRSSLSSLDGIYRVDSLLSYAETVSRDIDVFATTYEPNGLSEESFKSELDEIRSGKIVKITSVVDSSNIQHVPEHLFSEIPDGSVQKFLHLGLAIDLGVFGDADQLTTMKSEVEQTVAAMTGVTNNAIVYTVEDSWLTMDQYQALEAIRNLNISRISNHYTDKLLLQKQVDSLKTLIQYYENTLKAL